MFPIFFTLLLLCVDALLYISNKIRPEIIAFFSLFLLHVTGILTLEETFSGLSSPAVITVIGIFIISGALHRTGGTRYVSSLLQYWAKGSTTKLVFAIMLCAAGLSLFMNNIAAAAILLPVVRNLSSRSKVSLARLLIPMAFGTILGGMATLFTTSNILVSNVMHQYNLTGFGVLDFLPVGGIAALGGIVFTATIGWRLLPEKAAMNAISRQDILDKELSDLYHLKERLWDIQVESASMLASKTLSESSLGEKYGVSVLAIVRNHHLLLAPKAEVRIVPGDRLFVLGRKDRVLQLESPGTNVSALEKWIPEMNTSPEVGLVEVVLAPRASIVGQTLKQLRFRERYELSAVALWREDRSYRTDVGDIPLRYGDALLVYGPLSKLRLLEGETDFIVLQPEEKPIQPAYKGILTSLILLGAIVVSAFGILRTSEALFLAALLIIWMGLLTMDEAYKMVEWKVVFTIAGLLPLGIAMNKSGVTGFISQALMTQFSHHSLSYLLAGILVLSTGLTQFLSSQTTAIILSPIAITLATRMSMNPYAFGMAVALGSSIAFISPISHPVNMLVMGIGGYNFKSFLKVGLPLTIVVLVIILLTLPLMYPLSQ